MRSSGAAAGPAPTSRGRDRGPSGSIYWREAWKYGMRAFRYCHHDCGHAIAAVAYAAAALGWRTRSARRAERRGRRRAARARSRRGFRRRRARGARLPAVGRHRRDPDRRSARQGRDGRDVVRRRERPQPGARRVARDRSRARRDGPATHAARCALRAARRGADRAHTCARPAGCDGHPPAAQRRGLRRRDHDRRRGVLRDARAALPRAGVPPWDAWPHAAARASRLFVHRVVGLAPGLYVFVRAPEAAERLRRATRPDWLWRKVGPAALPISSSSSSTICAMPRDSSAATRTSPPTRASRSGCSPTSRRGSASRGAIGAVLGMRNARAGAVPRGRGRRHPRHRDRLLLRRRDARAARACGRARVAEPLPLHGGRRRGRSAPDDASRLCVRARAPARRAGWR